MAQKDVYTFCVLSFVCQVAAGSRLVSEARHENRLPLRRQRNRLDTKRRRQIHSFVKTYVLSVIASLPSNVSWLRGAYIRFAPCRLCLLCRLPPAHASSPRPAARIACSTASERRRCIAPRSAPEAAEERPVAREERPPVVSAPVFGDRSPAGIVLVRG